jgi:hypothetical protein
MHRRIATLPITLGAILLVLAGPGLAGSSQPVDSGGIGLTRAAWETEHGPGTPTDVSAPVYDEVYAWEGDVTTYVAFEGSKTERDDVAMYIEVVWGDAPVPFEEARATAEALLPADAAISEFYPSPPTPDGPLALHTYRYTSPSLATVPYGTSTLTPNVLVTCHARIEATNTGHQVIHELHVERVSIAVQLPVG